MKKGFSKPPVKIYTDGSCDPNPGPGGWAAIILSGRNKEIYKGSNPESTNNRMELTAALEGIRKVEKNNPIDLYTDSQYLKRGVEDWMPNWIARGWRRKGGRLANVDLWKQISEEIKQRDIRWHWVRGHAGNKYNEEVDRIAQSMSARG